MILPSAEIKLFDSLKFMQRDWSYCTQNVAEVLLSIACGKLRSWLH